MGIKVYGVLVLNLLYLKTDMFNIVFNCIQIGHMIWGNIALVIVHVYLIN